MRARADGYTLMFGTTNELVVAPAGLPPDVMAVLHGAVQALLADPAFHALRLGVGDIPAEPMSVADFAQFVKAEEKRLRAMVRHSPLM